jgi:branched-chain amino acid transport system permease protein
MTLKARETNLIGRLLPALALALAASTLLLPLVLEDAYSLHFAWKILFWAVLASAWNIAGGYAGQFSLGHAAFFGLGAYTSTLLYLKLGITPWLGLIAGGLVAAAFAAFIGALTLQLRGAFFALASIAFAEVLRISVVNLRTLTGGSEGQSIPFAPGLVNMMWPGRATSVLIMSGALILVVLVAVILERSRLGYALAAMREDEEAAESLGINTIRIKLISIALSAFLSAIAGTLYAFYILLIEPSTVLGIGFSIEIALVAIIGGMGTALGPLVGAILIVPLSEYLRAEFAGSLQGLHLVIYGLILMLMVMFLPYGLTSAVRDPRGAIRRIRTSLGVSSRKRPRQASNA